jgi:hypothetical protein
MTTSGLKDSIKQESLGLSMLARSYSDASDFSCEVCKSKLQLKYKELSGDI